MTRSGGLATGLLSRRSTFVVGALAAAGLSAYASYFSAFTGMQPYDDEGYILIALREYGRGGALYDEIYSQYGPAYFQLVASLFSLLQASFTHDNARWAVIVASTLTGLLCSAAVYRLTHNVPAALACQLLVAVQLIPSRNEPLHPGMLLCLLLAAVVVLMSYVDARRSPLVLATIGALTAAATLTKINVGVFAAAPLAFVLINEARSARRSMRLAAWAVGCSLPLIPLAVIARHLQTDWGRTYALVVACAIAAMVAVMLAGPARAFHGLDLLAVAVGFGVVAAVSVGLATARGTSLLGLVDGILLAPARHPGDFFYALRMPRATVWLSVLSVLAALGFVACRRRHPRVAEALAGAGSLLVGVVVGGAALSLYATHLRPTLIAAALPIAWLAAAGDASPARRFIVLLAALQSLHAYPIAGSQVAWATVLVLPVGAIAAADGWAWLHRQRSAWLRPRAVRAGLVVVAAVLVVAVPTAVFRRNFVPLRFAHEHGLPLGLVGAKRVRVDPAIGLVHQTLVQEIVERCRGLITMPGLNSLHLFTRIDPPTRLNTTAWFTLLSAQQQAMVIERLRTAPGPVCAVRNGRLMGFWATVRPLQDFERAPLAQYIARDFTTAVTVGQYEVMVRRPPER